jgi:hypothetical protein
LARRCSCMAVIIMGSDLGLMRGPNHPISDNVAFSSEVGTGSREENASKKETLHWIGL